MSWRCRLTESPLLTSDAFLMVLASFNSFKCECGDCCPDRLRTCQCQLAASSDRARPRSDLVAQGYGPTISSTRSSPSPPPLSLACDMCLAQRPTIQIELHPVRQIGQPTIEPKSLASLYQHTQTMDAYESSRSCRFAYASSVHLTLSELYRSRR